MITNGKRSEVAAVLFTPSWCAAVNRHVEQEPVLVSAPASANQATTGVAEGSVAAPVSLAIRVSLRPVNSEPYSGVVMLTPRSTPYVHVRTRADGDAYDAEVEFPLQVLTRVSGKAVTECSKDSWLPAMFRVNRGMDAIVELA